MNAARNNNIREKMKVDSILTDAKERKQLLRYEHMRWMNTDRLTKMT